MIFIFITEALSTRFTPTETPALRFINILRVKKRRALPVKICISDFKMTA